MFKSDVNSPAKALAFITDCQLATVTRLASKKSSAKYDLDRHISIAQTAVDWIMQFDVDYSRTRVEEVVAAGGSVEAWAKQFIPAPVTDTNA